MLHIIRGIVGQGAHSFCSEVKSWNKFAATILSVKPENDLRVEDTLLNSSMLYQVTDTCLKPLHMSNKPSTHK